MMNKKETRQFVLSLRAQLSEEERIIKSKQIQGQVLALPEFKESKMAMIFLNFRDEVETTHIAEEVKANGKRLVLPRCAPKGILVPALISDLESDIEPGMWGIREPKKDRLVEAETAEIDFVLVPGAAFDMQGNRLGYGAGYYDRFFQRLQPTVPKVAVAFACQVLPEVPVEEHDAKMTMLVTEEGVYRF